MVYQAQGNASPVGGLVNGNTYRVVVDAVNGNLIQLQDTVNGAVVELTPDRNSSAIHLLSMVSIGGLQDGVTYYVKSRTATGFQLSAPLEARQLPTSTPRDWEGRANLASVPKVSI